MNQANRPRVISAAVVTQQRCVKKKIFFFTKNALNLAQHFINDCPERSKPPENYICKICNEVCQTKSDEFCVNSCLCLNLSLDILFGIVQQEMQRGILAAESLILDISVVHVEAKDTILRTA